MLRGGFSRGVLVLLLMVVMFSEKTGSLWAAYNDTYVLAIKQKYAIPENVENGDFVGNWLKTWTWKTKGTISFSIEKNYRDAFAIHATTGLVTIKDASRINGKIVRQDTVINLIIRTSDSGSRSELDTAQIFVKENTFCRYIDYSYSGSESGTRTKPYNDLDDLKITPGFGYFIKRGNLIYDEYTAITSHLASKAHPSFFAAYGKGNKPKFTSGTNICFFIGDVTGGEEDPDVTRCEYVYFFDLHIRDYASAAFYCRRKSDNIAWYNMDIRNCDKNDKESTLAINTSFPDQKSISDSSAIYNFEILNCTFDTTSINCSSDCEKNFIKNGVGPTRITNCYFGYINGSSQPLRLTAGHGSIVRHCLFEPGSYNQQDENASGIQCRQDRVLIEDCIFNNLANGVYITNPGTAGSEAQPDRITVRNCYFKGQSLNGIMVRPVYTSDHPGYGHVFEDNLMENVANGIELRDCLNAVIRRNKITGGTGSGIYTGGSETSIGTSIHYNIIYGFGRDEIQISKGSGTNIFNNTIIGSINCNGSSGEKVYNNYASAFESLETSSNNIEIDTIDTKQHFVNYDGRDLRLKATAYSALKKGRDVGLKIDFAGNAVPGLPDIGALEYNASSASLNNIETVANLAPVMFDQEFTARQTNFKDLFVGKILAYDNNQDQKLTYEIIQGNENGLFNLNSQTGELKTTKADVFKPEPYMCEIIINVSDNGTTPKSQTAAIRVNFIGQSSIIYIDPENLGDLEENGTLEHPFDSWQDITWKTGNAYLQKSSTTAVVDKIVLGADNISLGSYGEGDLPVIQSETNTYLISGFEKKSITISNLHLQSPSAVSCIYFLGSTSDNIIIDHCTLQGVSNAVRIVDGQKFTVKYNTISCENEGIHSSAGITEIYYNVFKDNQVAVNVTSQKSMANIYNNVFVGNGESVSASYGELTLYNNIFYFTSAGQKALKYLSTQINSDHNIFYPEQSGFIEIANNRFSELDQLQQSLKIDLNSFSSDPKFQDIFRDNFALEYSSPAIDAGINLNLSIDFFGEEVPSARIPDIGISEFTGILSRKFRMDLHDSPELDVFPNPSAGHVNVKIQFNNKAPGDEVTTEDQGSTIKVVDISGNTLFSRLVEGTEDIIHEYFDLSSLSNGIYFIILERIGKPVTRKLILNR